MVLPPKQLSPKQRIFDLIDSIKSKITSQEYLDLMNTSKNLVETINDFEQDDMSEVSNDISLHYDELLNNTSCDCLSRFVYPDDFPRSGNQHTYSQMFCQGIYILQCENFKRFCGEYPLVNNLVRPQNIPFADIETYAPYELSTVKMVLFLIILLNEAINSKRHRIITMLLLFDFAMRNIKYLFDNRETFSRIVYDKFIYCMSDDEFMIIAEEFNINLNNWRVAFERAITPPVIY